VQGADDGEDLSVTAGLLMPFGETWCLKVGVQHSVWGKNADVATVIMAGVRLSF
jgi:hypothetical protein